MPLNITTNAAASAAGYYLEKNQKALQTSLTRLASGKKIIAPYDDPGSLSVSMKLQASINRLSGAQNNIRNGMSFLEVQDGILEAAGRVMDRMNELKGLAAQDPMKGSVTSHRTTTSSGTFRSNSTRCPSRPSMGSVCSRSKTTWAR